MCVLQVASEGEPEPTGTAQGTSAADEPGVDQCTENESTRTKSTIPNSDSNNSLYREEDEGMVSDLRYICHIATCL